MDKSLNLDFLLEPTKDVGTVSLEGVTYTLMAADLMENFLTLLAAGEKLKSHLQTESSDVAEMSSRIENLRQDLRSMIRVLVPDMPESLLRNKFPKLEQLQNLFTLLVLEVEKNLPESVKKNSCPTEITAEKTEPDEVIPSLR